MVIERVWLRRAESKSYWRLCKWRGEDSEIYPSFSYFTGLSLLITFTNEFRFVTLLGNFLFQDFHVVKKIQMWISEDASGLSSQILNIVDKCN